MKSGTRDWALLHEYDLEENNECVTSQLTQLAPCWHLDDTTSNISDTTIMACVIFVCQVIARSGLLEWGRADLLREWDVSFPAHAPVLGAELTRAHEMWTPDSRVVLPHFFFRGEAGALRVVVQSDAVPGPETLLGQVLREHDAKAGQDEMPLPRTLLALAYPSIHLGQIAPPPFSHSTTHPPALLPTSPRPASGPGLPTPPPNGHPILSAAPHPGQAGSALAGHS